MKKLLLEFVIIQIIDLIFKLTLCVRLLTRLQTFTIFFLINAFINVYYIFWTFVTSMISYISEKNMTSRWTETSGPITLWYIYDRRFDEATTADKNWPLSTVGWSTPISWRICCAFSQIQVFAGSCQKKFLSFI